MAPSKITATAVIAATAAIASAEVSATATSCPGNFCATLVESPARAILSRTITFHVKGQSIRNVELVPQYGYSPIIATFNTSPDGTSATLQLDTTQLFDQRLQPMRILAFDRPAGDKTAREILVMPARTLYIRNTAAPCESFDTINHTADGSPALLSGEPTSKLFCEPSSWPNNQQPPDCECAIYQH